LPQLLADSLTTVRDGRAAADVFQIVPEKLHSLVPRPADIIITAHLPQLPGFTHDTPRDQATSRAGRSVLTWMLQNRVPQSWVLYLDFGGLVHGVGYNGYPEPTYTFTPPPERPRAQTDRPQTGVLLTATSTPPPTREATTRPPSN
jgi:hypothetical protein